jgi:Cof subfamily protein (haloacid dehalogenase superfamily)
MSCLYVSDLDGTLLGSEGTLSDFGRRQLTELLEAGLPFTVASARSLATIREKLLDLPLTLPVINFNGAFLSDLGSGAHRFINSFDPDLLAEILDFFEGVGILPIFSTFDGERDSLYIERIDNAGLDWYAKERIAARDPRLRPPKPMSEIVREQVVCLTVIEREDRLAPIQEETRSRFDDRIRIYFYENAYSPGWFWMTLHDRRATKRHALEELLISEGMQADRLVVFGDHLNDLEMFELAGTSVAVANAHPVVLEIATHRIGPNTEDSVVRYLMEAHLR